MLNLNLFIEDERWQFSFPIEEIAKNIFEIIPLKKNGEISVVLTNDDYVKNLNKEYRGKDFSTNVLSFPYDDNGNDIGDIFLAFETIVKESSLNTFIDHTVHLIVHGVLHVLGYDHIKEDEAIIMEGLESKIMINLGLFDPWENN